MKNRCQPSILKPVPRVSRYLSFSLKPDADPRPTVKELCGMDFGEKCVVGFGRSLILALGSDIEALRVFPAMVGLGVDIPSTPFSLWFWWRGEDRGELIHRSKQIRRLLEGAFDLSQVIDGFRYGASLDLTGYEDGTENPKDADALEAAIVHGQGAGMDGSSFVAVQQWVHDLDHFQAMPHSEQDHAIGRRRSDNEEIDDAPLSAHVKRTAQESYQPEAFILRRSMPWSDADKEGLVFVAFGKSFDAFEALLKRMIGAEDGIVDALFRFTRPVSGAYYWCPPVAQGRLDLSLLGLSS